VIDIVFAWCVQILVWLAQVLGTSYEAVNVWIFVVIWPLFTVALVLLVVTQWFRIRTLLRERHSYLNGATI